MADSNQHAEAKLLLAVACSSADYFASGTLLVLCCTLLLTTLLEYSTSTVATTHVGLPAGNHEQEPNIDGVQFQSYLARFQAPGMQSGSNTTLYYRYAAC